MNVVGDGTKTATVMVLVEVAFAGMNVLYKLATSDGMNLFILIAYRLLCAAVLIVPAALLLERKRPELTKMVLLQAFLCGLFGGTLSQILFVQSIALTSATFTAAMVNLLPATTFIIGIIFREEKLRFRSVIGKAKMAGTIISVGGAMILILYKGPEINIWTSKINLDPHARNTNGRLASSTRDLLLGTLAAILSCVCSALWLIIQAKMLVGYPCPYSSTALMTAMALVQTLVFALCKEHQWEKWKLGWNIRLLAVGYSGIMVSGIMTALMTWCVKKRGPLFVSVFHPLILVIVAIAGSLLLNERLHLGSVLGGVLIICGLYSVLWGKKKEMKGLASVSVATSN